MMCKPLTSHCGGRVCVHMHMCTGFLKAGGEGYLLSKDCDTGFLLYGEAMSEEGKIKYYA